MFFWSSPPRLLCSASVLNIYIVCGGLEFEIDVSVEHFCLVYDSNSGIVLHIGWFLAIHDVATRFSTSFGVLSLLWGCFNLCLIYLSLYSNLLVNYRHNSSCARPNKYPSFAKEVWGFIISRARGVPNCNILRYHFDFWYFTWNGEYFYFAL